MDLNALFTVAGRHHTFKRSFVQFGVAHLIHHFGRIVELLRAKARGAPCHHAAKQSLHPACPDPSFQNMNNAATIGVGAGGEDLLNGFLRCVRVVVIDEDVALRATIAGDVPTPGSMYPQFRAIFRWKMWG